MENLLLMLGIGLLASAFVYLLLSGRGRRDEVSERLDRYTLGVQRKQKERGPGTRFSPLGERLDRALAERGLARNLRTQLARANLKLTAGEFIAATVICMILFPVLIFLWRRDPYLSLVGLILGFFAPRWYVAYLQGKRLKAFNDQLGDIINMMVNSLRAGYSVLQAMEVVAREMNPPASEEFDRVVKEAQLGLPLDRALDNLLRRVPSDDLDMTVTAIKIQQEVGGNLAEVLDTISFTIRERVRIKGEIRALTAQARYSGYVVSLLPVGVAGIVYMINPGFMGPLFQDPCGRIMLVVAGITMTIGFFTMRKIADIEV
ncbi:MAG: type II secretion system F family protein [Anaerolineae bacterium]|nr:type II secretion system F family protein [Anaerolineae bacterium]MDW8067338.1 type II secretion system F family protein [Anaerolineae bacterium]